jgi:hypothetical protein
MLPILQMGCSPRPERAHAALTGAGPLFRLRRHTYATESTGTRLPLAHTRSRPFGPQVHKNPGARFGLRGQVTTSAPQRTQPPLRSRRRAQRSP